MRKVTLGVKQLIILTHNFSFFKECQKAYYSKFEKDDEKKASLLNIILKKQGDNFYSYLENIPKTLKDNESEYHYYANKLFKADELGWDDPDLYGLVNACRRVLESFFCFKLPSNDNLKNKFDRLIEKMERQQGSDLPLKKIIANARERFIQVGSHGDSLDKILGLDNITLDSVRDAVEFTLDFIKEADEIHFEALRKASK